MHKLINPRLAPQPARHGDAERKRSIRESTILYKQRQDLVDNISNDVGADEYTNSHRVSENIDDDVQDGGYWIEDTVNPDDSITFRGVIAKPRHKGNVCQRELAELRRLVQSDDRFGRALERTCQAIYECMSSECNSSPVLALLASLVWNSLCILWELEPKNQLPKAHLRSRIEGLKGEHQHVIESFDNARREYLKEIVGLRDQIRKLDSNLVVQISSAVYEEEPVMFYEPLQYLSEKERLHVAEIVEEKVKLVLSKMDPTFIESLKKEKHQEDDEKDEDEKPGQELIQKLYESSKRRISQLEEQLEASKNANVGVRQSVRRMMTIASQEWEDLNSILVGTESSSQETSIDHQEVSSQCQSPTNAERRSQDHLGPRTSAERHSQIDEERRSQLERRSQVENGLPSSADHSRLSLLTQQPSNGESMDDIQERIAYVTGLLQAERQFRKSLQAQLDFAQRSAVMNASIEPIEDPLASKEAELMADLEQQEAKLREAKLLESQLQQSLVDQERARARAEERAKNLEREIARLKAQLAERGATDQNSDELRHQMQLELENSEKLRLETARALEKALQTIEELREEIRRLKEENRLNSRRQLIEDQETTGNMVFSESLHWRTPTGKVFERLFQDSVARVSRRGALVASLQQARNEQAVEIFRSHLRQMSSSGYDLSVSDYSSSEMDLCPEVLQSQVSSWVVDRSKKSFVEVDDCPTAETLRSDISATVNAELAHGKGSSSRTLTHRDRSHSPPSPSHQGPSTPFEKSARSRSPIDRGLNNIESSQVNMIVEGTHVGPSLNSTRLNRESSPENEPKLDCDTIAEHCTHTADQKEGKGHFKDFAASLGLACPTDLPIVQGTGEAPSQPLRRPPASSRPNSAQMLRRAKQTITARPKSAALFTRMQRPHSEVALAREAQRLLSQKPPLKPVAQRSDTLSIALGRCSSAPAVRSNRDKLAKHWTLNAQ